MAERARSESALGGRLFAGKWILERVLGRGGMGVVVAARHARLGHRVALKVLGPGLRAQPDLIARFEREARAASALESSHAVKVHDIDVAGDHPPYLVMELLDGCDLAEVIERDGPPPIACSVDWVMQACDAIAEAHRRGIVHRDIKPSNLFLSVRRASAPEERGGHSEPTIKVLDFGIAKVEAPASGPQRNITGELASLGTPHYMSPEQVRCARDVDARSDVWSLGATLFELLTGEAPYPHDEPYACIAAIVADPVRDPRVLRPELPEGLVRVVMRTLSKDPADRYPTAAELASALGEALATVPRGEAPFRASLVLSTEPDVAFGLDELGEVDVPEPPRSTPLVPLRPPAVRSASRWRRDGAIAAFAVLCTVAALPKCVADAPLSHHLAPSAACSRVATVVASVAARAAHEASLAEERLTAPPLPVRSRPAPRSSRPPVVTPVRRAPREELASPPKVMVHGGLGSPGF